MMRPYLAVALGLAGCARAGSGSSPGGGDDTPGPDSSQPTDAARDIDAAPPGPPPIDAAQIKTLLQTADTNLAAVPSPTCVYKINGVETGETSDNSWYRVFSLAEHGISNRPFYLQSVGFTILSAHGSPQAQIKVGTYTGTLGSNTLDVAKVTARDATTITLPDTTTGLALTAPITETIPADTLLIVEVFVPDLGGTGKGAKIASTSSAETHFAYTRSDGCKVMVPQNIAAISSAFLNSHVVITATGQY